MEHTDLELYIQIRNGQPHEHPIFADNFKLAFPEVNVNDLPADQFAKFIRVDAPVPDTYEVYEGVTYQWVDGVVKDVHSIRPMTDEERSVKDVELTELTTQAANKMHQMRMDRCQKTADETEDATQKQLWLDCLAAHQAWVLESVNPITPAFPPFPKQD